MQILSDDILLDQLKNEDNAAYGLLYKFYFASLASYILQNTGNNEDAEDVFQETIIVLLKNLKLPGFTLTSSLKTYLYAIAKNIWLKKSRVNKAIKGELTLSDCDYENFSIEVHPEKSNEEKIISWIQKITANCQRILKAIFFYHEPMDSLMIKMGWKNKHTAQNQQYKCIQQVKKIKEKEENTS